VFNVGDTNQNYQKKTLADFLLKLFPDAKIKYVEKVEDPRDYRVDFSKINKALGFYTTISVEEGMKTIAKAILDGVFEDPDDKKYVVC
jgi:nucleoside-diphosphate-sugar epimerase